jgi:hypothetical protein
VVLYACDANAILEARENNKKDWPRTIDRRYRGVRLLLTTPTVRDWKGVGTPRGNFLRINKPIASAKIEEVAFSIRMIGVPFCFLPISSSETLNPITTKTQTFGT